MNTKSLVCTLGLHLRRILPLIVLQNVEAHDGGFGHSRRTIFFDATADSFVLEYRVTRNSDEALLEMTPDRCRRRRTDLSHRTTDVFSVVGNRTGLNNLTIRTADGHESSRGSLGINCSPIWCSPFCYSIATTAAEIRFVDRNFPHKPGVVKVLAGSGVKAELAEPMDLNHAERVSLKVVRTGR